MKRAFKWVVGAVLVAAVAWAAKEQVDPDGSKFARWFGKGLYVGPTKVTTTVTNKVGHIAGCKVDYDFPGIITLGAGWQVETPNMTCTGVKLGDACMVGVSSAAPTDAGSAYEHQILVEAIAVKNDYVKLREYSMSGDAGDMNPPDAGYNVVCVGMGAGSEL